MRICKNQKKNTVEQIIKYIVGFIFFGGLNQILCLISHSIRF